MVSTGGHGKEEKVTAVRWIVLGTAPAVPDEEHANTHFALVDGGRLVLVDAPEGASLHLTRVGLSPLALTDIVLTHFHPDHVGGLAPLLMGLWLRGRTQPLHLYGLEATLDRVKALMDLFSWQDWPQFYPLVWHPLPPEERAFVLETEHTRWWASPGQHTVPSIGLRVERTPQGQALTYSSDTEPCGAIARLAKGATLLFHEATGALVGHTSPAQAAALAKRAGVERLCLVHLQPSKVEEALTEARAVFPGPVEVPKFAQVFDLR